LKPVTPVLADGGFMTAMWRELAAFVNDNKGLAQSPNAFLDDKRCYAAFYDTGCR